MALQDSCHGNDAEGCTPARHTHMLSEEEGPEPVLSVEADGIREAREAVTVENALVAQKNLDIIVPNLCSRTA